MDKKVNRENIDSYYELVNKKIDYYFDKSVSPQALVRYFSKDYGIEKFIKREKLDDVDGIKKVIKDVVEDRMALDENVKTFEQYNEKVKDRFNIFFDITQDIEKEISDYYRVSLGHIDSNKNKIKLKGIKREQELFVFTSSNLKEIYSNVATNMYDVFSHKLTFEYPPLNIKVDISSDIIDKEKFVNSFYSQIRKNFEIIEELIYLETGDVYKKIDPLDDIFIYEKNDD